MWGLYQLVCKDIQKGGSAVETISTLSPMLSNGWCLVLDRLATPESATFPGTGFKGICHSPHLTGFAGVRRSSIGGASFLFCV